MNKNINAESNIQEADTMMNKTAENNNMEANAMKNNNNVEVETMTDNTNINTEAEAMAGKNNRNTGAASSTTGIKGKSATIWNDMTSGNMFSNISEIIPEEEAAVSEAKPMEAIKQFSVVDTIMPCESVVMQIPENEREEIDEETRIDLKESTKYGCFSPTVGMMGFKVNTGQVFFARILTDSKGSRWIEYCQQYKDGSCCAKMKVKQADLVIATMYLINEMKEEKQPSKFLPKNTVNKIIMNARNDYYNKAVFPQECVCIEQIFLLLLNVYKSLPTENTVLESYEYPEKLYADVMAAIKKDPAYAKGNEHKAYYALTSDYIDKIAGELGMKRDLLLKKLKEYKFLYLTDSSKGYQTCVRFTAGKSGLQQEFLPKSYTQWSYCIWKLEYLAGQLAKRGQE